MIEMNEFRRGWKVVVAAMVGVSLSSTNITYSGGRPRARRIPEISHQR